MSIKEILYKIKKKRDIRFKSINIGSKSMKAVWTSQMADDLSTLHGLDFSSEVEKLLVNELKNGNSL